MKKHMQSNQGRNVSMPCHMNRVLTLMPEDFRVESSNYNRRQKIFFYGYILWKTQATLYWEGGNALIRLEIGKA